MSPPIINLTTNYAFPVCLSGITHPLALSKEMADHERRRKAIKKLKFESREALYADQEVRTYEEIRGDGGQDLVGFVHDLSCTFPPCTAKAA